jgi:hypothetical protein
VNSSCAPVESSGTSTTPPTSADGDEHEHLGDQDQARREVRDQRRSEQQPEGHDDLAGHVWWPL